MKRHKRADRTIMGYDVIVTDASDEILAMVSAVVGEEENMGEVDAATLATLLPLSVVTDVSQDEAERYTRELEALGATVAVRPTSS